MRARSDPVGEGDTALALAQTLQSLALRVLGLLNDDIGFPETINSVVCAIRSSLDVEAAAIRLRNGGKFPFVASSGFPDAFLEAESRLGGCNANGELCRVQHGEPLLACTCGLAVCGCSRSPDDVEPLTGSRFLNQGVDPSVSEDCGVNPCGHVRNHYVRERYQSMAWVPIRARRETVGLLLMCDKRPNRFSAEAVAFLEGMSASIGLALTRKQAEEELHLKRTNLDLARQSMGMGTWRWNIDGDTRSCDDQACRLLGILPERHEGTNEEFFRLVHVDDREMVKAALQHTLTTSDPYEVEYRVLSKDGTIRYVAARGICIRDSSGRPIRVEGLLWDITERHATIAALHRNEALQRAMLSNISDVVAIIDKAGINRFKSSNLSKWFGWLPEEVVGRPAAEHIHPDDQERIAEQFAALKNRPGATKSVECRYLCKNGEYRWIELNAVNLLHDKDIAGVLLNFHDISQRQRALAASHESEQRYRVLFHNSQDALLTVAAPDWHVLDCNPAAVALFGLSDASDFNAHPPWNMSPECQPDGSLSHEKALSLLEAATRAGSCSCEWIHRNARGEDFPATVSLVAVKLNGRALIQATVRDESERQRLFARMAQADRLATMGMLAGGVAHEINNPLAFVRYDLESLAEDLPGLTGAVRRVLGSLRNALSVDKVQQLLGTDEKWFTDSSLEDINARGTEALEGIERIISIARALSTFSRVEQGNRARVNVAVAIEAAVNMAHNEVTHRARLTSKIESLPCVWASEGKLSHAFLNLLVNAAHAIDEGDVSNNLISIRAWAESESVIVEISGTGRAIDPEVLKRTLEPPHATKRLGSGPGLGIAIARSILTEFGGTLGITSEPNSGTLFTARLPIIKELPSRAPAEKPAAFSNASSKGARILVIDDEPNVGKAVTRILGSEYTVVAVACGKDAQVLVSSDPNFDIILCDLMMSAVSGTEFHAWLVEHCPGLAQRLIFITGGAFTPKARDYLARVDNPTIDKPFEPAELRQRIREFIRTGRREN